MTTFLEIGGFVVVLAILFYAQFRSSQRSTRSMDASLDEMLSRHGLTRIAPAERTTDLSRIYEGTIAGRRVKLTLAVSFFKLLSGRARPGGAFVLERFSRHVEGDRHHHAVANRFECDLATPNTLGLQITDRAIAEQREGSTEPWIGFRYHVEDRFAECSADRKSVV